MTLILLDTSYLLWALEAPEVMPPLVQSSIVAPENEIYFSAVSIWEIAIKSALRKADFYAQPDEVAQAARETGFNELAITSREAAWVARLPLYHRDPFDRLLIAHALALPAKFLTADAQLGQYSELVWVV